MTDPKTPHGFSGIIYDINLIALDDAIVKLINTRTGDTLTKTTQSGGQFTFDLSNFSSGWVLNDRIFMQSWKDGNIFKTESTFITISGSSTEQNLTLKPLINRIVKNKDIKEIQTEEYSPTANAKRSVLVDENGKIIDSNNPLDVNMNTDIQIGAVEIKDHDSDTRVEVTSLNALKTDNPVLTSRVDEADANNTYVGDAVVGSGEAASVWRIMKLIQDGNVLSKLFADGNENFDNQWSGRAGLSYS